MASFATFSPYLKATHTGDNLPRILIGMGVTDAVSFVAAVDMNGVIELVSIDKILIDWRYDPKTEMWDDVGSKVASSPFGEE